MPLSKEQAIPGVRLQGRYKGQAFAATVVASERGLRYRLPDGREFRSPSGAGRAVITLAGPTRPPKSSGRPNPGSASTWSTVSGTCAICTAPPFEVQRSSGARSR